MNSHLIVLLALSLLQISPPGFDSDKTCVLLGTGNGEFVQISGEVMPTAHDMLLRPESCSKRVLLELPTALRGDPEFRKFESLVSAQRDPEPNVICRECPKYKVWAEFKGRLDVSQNAGAIRDLKTGKVSVEGYGHPLPFTRYRLAVSTVRVLRTENRN